MSVYIKPCAKCRRTRSARATPVRKHKACGDCRWIAIAPPSLGRKGLGVFGTKREAENAVNDAVLNAERGIDLVPSRVTVKVLLDRYISDRASLGRGAKTIDEYRRFNRLYIEPRLGYCIVSKLRPAHVGEWISTLLKEGGIVVEDAEKGRCLSAKTVRHAFTLLSAALTWGTRVQLVARNVCTLVSAPSVRPSEARAFTSDEITSLLFVSRGSRWGAFVILALTIGARRGELCGLNWEHVDLDEGRVTVRQSVSQIKDSVAIKGTKSGRARVLPLSRMAIEALKTQKALQEADRGCAGALYRDEGAVFTDELGGRLTPKAATNGFARLAGKAGLSTTRLHDARHTAATTMLSNGVDPTTAAAILGHSSPTVTLQIYSHLVPGAQRGAMDRLGERMEALASIDCNQTATNIRNAKKKARVTGLLMVAGTGFEPVTFGL
jgi:integrase